MVTTCLTDNSDNSLNPSVCGEYIEIELPFVEISTSTLVTTVMFSGQFCL
jgi:hypothetical protein